MIDILTVTSLNNQTYGALSNIPRVRRVNGEREITLSFLHNEINDEFIADIETGWTVNFKGDVYHLFNEREDRHGNKQFDAVLDFFQHFNGKWHVDEVDDQSMTVNDSIRPLFDDSPYVLSIIDNFYANTMNYSRQQNSTERFLYFIGRHNAEFNIPIGTRTVQLRNRIGVKRNDIFIHEDDNLIDLSISTDTSSFCTAIKGYYRFRAPEGSENEESTEKEPTRTYDYISPMASKYGVIWGEPIWDERYDTEDGIKEACRLKQESTWKVSFDLNAELFENPLNEGDEIRFIMPSKKINNYIRVVEINEEFDEEGDLIGASYTFGNEKISRQFRNMQYDAIKDISDIMNGRKPIPFSVLPRAVREATDVINAGDSTQFYYRSDGIYGYNTANPLGVTRYNANGIGFSQDGGQTFENAMTYLGIVATAITSGTIDTNNVTIYGDEGYNRIEITGDKIKVWDSRDPEVYTEMSRGRIHANHGALSVSRDDAYIDSSGKQWGMWIQDGKPKLSNDISRNVFMHPIDNLTRGKQRYNLRLNPDVAPEETYSLETFYGTHDYRFITVSIGIGHTRETGSNNIIVEIRNMHTNEIVSSIRIFKRAGEDISWHEMTFERGVPDYESSLAYQIYLGASLNYGGSVTATINRIRGHG